MLYKSLVTKISIPPEKKTKQKEYLEIGLLPIVDQGKEIIGGYTNEVEKNIVCNLPVIVFGDHTCSVKYINFPFGAGADGIKILKAKDNVLPQYLFYGTQYLVFHLHDRGYARHYQHIEKMDLYVPPIEEQRRIVSRIEELFSELDSAVETLQKTRQQLEIYRQAVLKEAFENCKIQVRFGDIIISRLGKMLDKKKNVGVERTYLRNANVRWFDFDLSNLLQMRITDDEIDRYSLHKGDLVICEGGEPGRCAIWKKDEMIFYQKALHRVRFKTKCKPEFYMYYMSYIAKTGTINEYFTGTGIKHLTGESLSKIPVPSTSYSQQEKITSEIELKMSVCDSIEKTVNEALQQAEAMRQSILKKAFEREL